MFEIRKIAAEVSQELVIVVVGVTGTPHKVLHEHSSCFFPVIHAGIPMDGLRGRAHELDLVQKDSDFHRGSGLGAAQYTSLKVQVTRHVFFAVKPFKPFFLNRSRILA